MPAGQKNCVPFKPGTGQQRYRKKIGCLVILGIEILSPTGHNSIVSDQGSYSSVKDRSAKTHENEFKICLHRIPDL
jgi:hypothetical protein